jgi:CHAT domain-containing protein
MSSFLWTLPFQALTNRRGNYLIQDYSLFYAPSFSVLNEMALRSQQQNSEESLIAFGNPVIDRNGDLKRNLHPLPETEVEVAAIAATTRTQMKKVLVRRKADERPSSLLRHNTPQFTLPLTVSWITENL